MASLPVIRQFKSIKNLGVFRKHVASAGCPQFRHLNLIYGFNGTGKTTLSRIFGSLEAGIVRPELPLGGEFEIELTNGNVISSAGPLNALKGRLVVFDVDFVSANFRWKEGTANPVFYLGKEQTTLSKRLEAIEKSSSDIFPKRDQALKVAASAERSFSIYKRDAARQIGEQINQSRNYDATDIAADYEKHIYSDKYKLGEDERKQLRQLINADSALPKLPFIGGTTPSFKLLVRETKQSLNSTVGTLAIESLLKHESMLTWVKTGFDYHREHKISSCLFCGNYLTDERMTALSSALDTKFDQLLVNIENAKKSTEQLYDRLVAVQSIIPSKNDIATEHVAKFQIVSSSLQSLISLGLGRLNSVSKLLKKKTATPNSIVKHDDMTSESDAEQWDAEFTARLKEMNLLIEAHNGANDTFFQSQLTARKRLKEHHLAESQTHYKELEQAVDDAKRLADKLNAIAEDLRRQADEIRQTIRQHGPAAELINRLITNYLGHKSLRIEIQDEGYKIIRADGTETGLLSEGEKTAIALCYFICTLEAEGRRLSDLIVVVDDPISSLDTRALNYAFNLIKGAIANAAQVIILTHNLHFMNEVKKWLRDKVAKGQASLLFLDATQDSKSNLRETKIIELPRLIREYESEYHYLFSLILGLVESPDTYKDHFYLMPNALRKTLEIFLAFKVPGSTGLAGKLDNSIVRDSGIDPKKIRALDRLAQFESHADSLDDLISFSSITIEETKDAAEALNALFQAADAAHYEQMCKLCR